MPPRPKPGHVACRNPSCPRDDQPLLVYNFQLEPYSCVSVSPSSLRFVGICPSPPPSRARKLTASPLMSDIPTMAGPSPVETSARICVRMRHRVSCRYGEGGASTKGRRRVDAAREPRRHDVGPRRLRYVHRYGPHLDDELAGDGHGYGRQMLGVPIPYFSDVPKFP